MGSRNNRDLCDDYIERDKEWRENHLGVEKMCVVSCAHSHLTIEAYVVC